MFDQTGRISTRLRLRLLWLLLAFAVAPGFAQSPAPHPPPEPQIKSYSLPPDKLKKAVEYARIRNRLYFVSAVWGLVVLAGVIATRVAPRYRDWAERVSRRRIVQAYIFTPPLLLTLDL